MDQEADNALAQAAQASRRRAPRPRRPLSTHEIENLLKGLAVVAVVVFAIVYISTRDPSSGHGGGGGGLPAVRVSAPSLMSEYLTNELRADGEFKGRVLVVSGEVDSVKRDILNQAYVTLRTENAIRRVQCVFDEGLVGQIVNLTPGDQVTISGACEGLMGNVLLKHCSRN